MQPHRREFLARLGCLSGAALAGTCTHASASTPTTPADPYAVLVDLTMCVGCRLCEHACKKAAGIDPGPLESYDDQSVFQQYRRPVPNAFTVVNAHPRREAPGRPVYAKVNCMHCNHAACVSACIVGALQKQPSGAVTYDAWKCIGCRYCMVACPFQIPTYTYDDVLTPEVRKCTFCSERLEHGRIPACVEACPRQAMIFGKRSELLRMAHEVKLGGNDGRYVPHVYGEHEVGGTCWLYVSDVPFHEVGFLKLGTTAPPALTEAIQHGVFKYWIAPVGWYGFLAGMMWLTGRRARRAASPALDEREDEPLRHPIHSHALATAGVAVHDENAATVALADPPQEHWTEGYESGPDEPLAPRPSSDDDNGKPAAAHPNHDAGHAEPAGGKFLTPGVIVLLGLVLAGLAAGLYRFIFGLAASTNLNQQYPWGLWIAMDVGSGIALAGGGFVTAALVHIFHREHYHAVARSALLTALLGYTFYVPGLLADIGRWYNIWHPMLPSMWQGNSVLFEVGICVMLYLNVQYAELAPIVLERFLGGNMRHSRLRRWMDLIHRGLEKVMPALLVLGVTLSTFHQSSLGNLMVIAPYKLHELWWTPVSPILFLLSAMMVGFPMVIFTLIFASWSLKRRPPMHVLAPLARYVPPMLGAYLALKIGDMAVRGTWTHLLNGSWQGLMWTFEIGLGVVLPLGLFLRSAVRNSPRWLAAACLTVIFGVVLNRLNVFVIAYSPPYATGRYFPSLVEFALSIGLVAALLLTYRLAVTYLPILEPPRKAAA